MVVRGALKWEPETSKLLHLTQRPLANPRLRQNKNRLELRSTYNKTARARNRAVAQARDVDIQHLSRTTARHPGTIGENRVQQPSSPPTMEAPTSPPDHGPPEGYRPGGPRDEAKNAGSSSSPADSPPVDDGDPSLDPVPADVLAESETRRRNAAKEKGPLGSGCAELDDYLLLGGFERGCVVGVSAEEEEAVGVTVGHPNEHPTS